MNRETRDNKVNTSPIPTYISGDLTFFQTLKYKLHYKISSLFGDGDYLKNPVKLTQYHKSIPDLIPTILYDEVNECFINDTTIGFILEGNPITGADMNIVKTITNLITDLPEGTTIQVNNIASSKIDTILHTFQDKRKNAKSIYQSLADKRVKHFKHNNWSSVFQTSPYLIRDFRVIISVSIPMSINPNVLNKFDSIKSKLRSVLSKKTYHHSDYSKQEELISSQSVLLNKLKHSFISTLRSVGIFTYEYKDTELLHYLDELINPNRNNEDRFPIYYRPDSTLNQQIKTDNILAVHKHHISLFADDDNRRVCVKSFNAKTYPDYLGLWQTEDLIGEYYNDLAQIPCPFITSFTIQIPSNTNSKHAKTLAKATRAIQQSETPLAKYIPELKEKAQDFIFTTKHIREGQRLVDTYFQVSLFATPDKLEEASSILTSIYKKKSFQLICEKYMALQSFMALIPFNNAEGLMQDLKYGSRTDTMLTWTCANLMPILAESIGDIHSPCMMLFGRRGQPLFWNPFANKGGNYNTAVVGKSGSGKSVFMQELVTSLLGFGGKVYVIDDGRSFMNSCKLQGGEFVEFISGANICINPFSLLSDNQKEGSKYSIDDVLSNSNPDKYDPNHVISLQDDIDNNSEVFILINTMIRQMARSQSSTTELENSFISEAIDKAYKLRGNKATITTVRDILHNQDDSRAKDIAKCLRPFTIDGEYREYFEGSANIRVESAFMVFELSEIKNKKDLQGIVMQFIMFLVFQQMYMGDRQQSISIVIDEAWDLLHGEETGKFIEGLARRARKYKGNIITGTQSINDYYKTPATKAIIENSDWTCLLSQKAESVEAFKESGRVLMDETMERTLKSLKMVDHQYSEIMICGNGGYNIGRLIVDPYAIAVYSSKAEDFNKIQDLTKQGMSVAEALERITEHNSDYKI